MFIKKVAVWNWGPIGELEFDFMPGVFLLYGKNESGKSSLVEAILSALVRDPRKVMSYGRWEDDFRGASVVRLCMDDGSDMTMKFPSRKGKSDKHLRMRLLFSWANEVESAEIVSELLCSWLLPRYILSWNPTEGMGLSGIVDGRLSGQKRGKYKLFMDKVSQWNNIIRLEDDFYKYGEIEFLQLQKELNELEQRKIFIAELKKKAAYRIFLELKKIEEEIEKHSKDELEYLVELRIKLDEVNRAISSIESINIEEDDLLWWQGVVDELKLLDRKMPVSYIVAVFVGIVLFFISVILSNMFIRLLVLVVAVVLIMAGQGLLLFVRDERRIKRILEQAAKRSGIDFVSKEQVVNYFEHLKKQEYHKEMKEREKEKFISEKVYLENEIKKVIGDRDIDDYIKQERKLISELEKRWKQLYGRFKELGFKEEDFEEYFDDVEEDEFEEYDIEEEIRIDRRINELKDRFHELSTEWAVLCGKIGGQAGQMDGGSLSKKWFLAIKEKKKHTEEEIKHMACSMVAAVAWKNVLDRKKKVLFEDVSSVVSDGVFREYLSLVFETEDISVEVKKGNVFLIRNGTSIPFDWLSHGAKHQLLFVLKSAMAQRLYHNPMFFILDDVFVFSDGERLDRQIRGLFNMSDTGWQIIYFTSNPWIRDRFERCGAKVLCL